jgi:hypothetical protein
MAIQDMDPIESLDSLSFCVTPVTMLFDDVVLSEATGFFYAGVLGTTPVLLLVSNWHVFSGRHIEPPNITLNKDGMIPNRMMFQVMKIMPDKVVQLHEQIVDLYDSDHKAFWHQHSLKHEVDVGVLYLGQLLTEFSVGGINSRANQYDMKIEIGDDVFVLGYPLGFSHFMKTPIWKRGSIASEPHTETPKSRNRVVIDATTRRGMSGSPVIVRHKTHYISETGQIKEHANASRLLGVYSSRPVFAAAQSLIDGQEDSRAELGYVYKSGLIDQTIHEGIPGQNYGELP